VETQQAKAPASNSSGIAPVNRRSFTAEGVLERESSFALR